MNMQVLISSIGYRRDMIIYDKLWLHLKEKGISQSKLYKEYGISRAQIHRLKHNEVVKTSTLDMLCEILECEDISDIVSYVPNNNTTTQ